MAAGISGALTIVNLFGPTPPGTATAPATVPAPAPAPARAGPEIAMQHEQVTASLAPKTPGQWIVDVAGGADADSRTIQPVLTSARSGDTVLVRAGTYRETIELGTSQVTLRGIAKRGQKTVIEGFGQPTVTMNGGRATIEDVTIEQKGGGSFRAVSTRNLSTLTLRNCDIVSTSDSAIVAEGGHLRVENCTATSTETKAGIGLKTGAEGEIVNCEVFANMTVGIGVEEGSRAVIDGCHVRGNGHFAITILEGARATIRSCAIFQNPKSGVAADGAGAKVEMSDCELFENGVALEVEGGARSRVAGTAIHDNEYAAHALAKGASLTLEHCEVRNQKKGGIQIDDGASAQITHSRLVSNGSWSVLLVRKSQDGGADRASIAIDDSDIAESKTGVAVGSGTVAKLIGNRFAANETQLHAEPGASVQQSQNTFQGTPLARAARPALPGAALPIAPPTAPAAAPSALQAGDRPSDSGPGTPLRKTILDSIRAHLKERTGADFTFSVLHLEAAATWALALVTPQAANRNLPPAGFLLNRTDDRWEITAALSSDSPSARDPAVLACSIQRMAGNWPSPPPASIFPGPQATREDAVRVFIHSYLLAGDVDDLDWQLAYFDTAGGGRVDYYDEGKLSAEEIRRSAESYNRRWPQRRVILDGEPKVGSLGEGRLTTSFAIRFEDINKSEGVRGRAAVTMTLVEKGGLLAIRSVSSKPLDRQKFTVSTKESPKAQPIQARQTRTEPGVELGRALKRSIHIGGKTLEDLFPTR